jgi:excinuclease ABC subunit C
LERIPVISLAKRLEIIYSPEGKQIQLSTESKALHLLQRIRDEAHRFAISYHRVLRQKDMRTSSLDAITGIGPKRKRALLRHFGSLAAIEKAKAEDLLQIEGIDKKTADNIIRYFKK